MNDHDKDIEERLKRAESGIFWCNIFIVLLCVSLAVASWHIWQILLTQEAFNNLVLEVFNSMRTK